MAEEFAGADTKVSLTYEHYQFVRSNTEFFRDEASNGLELFTLGFKQKKDWNANWFSNVDANILISPIEKKFYINATEFYLSNKSKSLSIGRKQQQWSWLDSYWDMGLWQPRFMWEKASPDQIGLLGFFYNKQWSKKIKSLFYVSPLYLPEFSAGSHREDGRFSSENPWFNPPVGLVEIPGLGERDIFYEVNKPAFIDVALRPSIGFMTRLGEASNWAQVSYAYKPHNKLFTNIDESLILGEDKIVLDGEETDIIEPRSVDARVEVLPELFYHHLLGVESQFTLSSKWSLMTAYQFEAADRELNFNSEITYKGLSDGRIGAIAFKRFFSSELSSAYVSLGYMKLSGGDEPDKGKLASEEKSLFANHYRFKNAIKAEAFFPQVFLLNKYFSSNSSVIYDLDFDGIVFSHKMNMSYNESWKFSLSVDLIGLLDDQDIKKSFMSSYRSNDNVSVGVSYVF